MEVTRRNSVALIVLLAVFVLSACTPVSEPSHSTIEGIVTKVEFIKDSGNFFDPATQHTIVTFKDGRIKTFWGISRAVFQTGVRNAIVYDNLDRIISVTTR